MTEMLDFLILSEDYPDTNSNAMRFVHNRAAAYREAGLNVAVLSFRENIRREYEGITVYPPGSALPAYRGIICHAPNLKHHYRFLRRVDKEKPLIFFFHGHEVLNISEDYPAPVFGDTRRQSTWFQPLYDKMKFRLWHRFIKVNKDRLLLVYVSRWMRRKTADHLRLNALRPLHEVVIPNAVHPVFEHHRHQLSDHAAYDFMTVRSNLDAPKYAVDLVLKCAESHPELSFLLIGRGEIFTHINKPSNVAHLDKILTPAEIAPLTDRCRCALMPTRLDAQGLMSCELAATGMPLITSDIPVCREVFSGYKNVRLVDNETIGSTDLSAMLNQFEAHGPYEPNTAYSFENTVGREIETVKAWLNH